ncbi:MAG: L-malyl-CoA/beta-methylmalyl-CoA lyase [Alphaproteobacteria bacterium MarineAlpha9_Bin4]|nr:MAG: L-malyl-CoA/beta-methylmalyl-CoA lyase [Alphaproteobacteria bacterium MarineAlpha9_Bin4]
MLEKLKNKPFRLNRSELAVPGSRSDFFEKAAQGNSDIVFLDLEDSVAIEKKDQARINVVEAIEGIDWGKKTLSVRVNSMDTDFFEKDILSLLDTKNERLDLLMLPKVNSDKDVLKLEKVVRQLEKKNKREKRLGFELIIETAKGLINVNNIAGASNRVESLHFGAADFGTSIGAKTMSIGGASNFYGTLSQLHKKNKKRTLFLNDIWQVALFNINLAASAHDLRAVDCPYGDFNDNEGFEALAKSSYSLGFDGKMVIHPNQINIANKVYSPTKKELLEAKEMLHIIEKSSQEGKGAVVFQGKMLDIVTVKQAKNIVELHNKIVSRSKND